MSSGISIRGVRTGFLFVVCILAAATAFTLWSELRTNEQVDALVSHALARDALVGRIRVDALVLEAAVDDHIQAPTDEDRQAADDRMGKILASISVASAEYMQNMRDVPSAELGIWHQLHDTCQLLAKQVRKAVNYSHRKEAERAKKHLVSEVRPISATLDRLGTELSRTNAEHTSQVLRQLEDLRLRTTVGGALVAVLALLVSLLVGVRLTATLRKQEQTIQAQLLELGDRNRELDAFASRVAHDLVAPLSPLKGYLTLIRRSGAVTDKDVQEMIALAESSAGRMAELVEALLRFCRAGTPSDSSASVLDTSVQAILLEASQTAAAQGVKLERQLEQNLAVPCAAQLVQSIAQNLLSNAIKYSAGRAEAKVLVRVFRDKGQAVLEVTDNGRGMNEESVRQLFVPFFRASATKHLPGHGLGLATCKRLIDAHGGSLAVRSQPEVGTQVTVRFSIATQPPLNDRNHFAAAG